MAAEFYVNMQKRGDGKVYADLHKTDGLTYPTEQEAKSALEDTLVPGGKQVTKLIALTEDEYKELTHLNHFEASSIIAMARAWVQAALKWERAKTGVYGPNSEKHFTEALDAESKFKKLVNSFIKE
jgi:hypothetical protein